MLGLSDVSEDVEHVGTASWFVCAGRVEAEIAERLAACGYQMLRPILAEEPGTNQRWRPNFPEALRLAQRFAAEIDPAIRIWAHGYRMVMHVE